MLVVRSSLIQWRQIPLVIHINECGFTLLDVLVSAL